MNVEPINTLTPGQLAQLLDIDGRVNWGEQDAAAALRHQLATPLMPDLAGLCRRSREAGLELGLSDRTFLRELTTDRPDLDLLRGIKRFARQMVDEKASPLSGGPASVLYFAAIARARFCLRIRISQLTDEQIAEGCQWAIKQEGAGELHGALFQAGGSFR